MTDLAESPSRSAVVEALALSFFDDPVTSWVFDDPVTRPEQLRVWWGWMIDNRLEHVEVLGTADGLSAAIWHGPDPIERDPADDGSGFYGMLAGLLGAEVAQRKLEGMAVIPAAHPTERHWYLAAVGTRPEAQGRGNGLRVVQPILDRCDAAGVPAYLESSNPRNEPFYERLGFAATSKIRIPDGPILTAMWRRPRPASRR